MERKLNGFIHKEKDEPKMRKITYATQKNRNVERHDVEGNGTVDSNMDD